MFSLGLLPRSGRRALERALFEPLPALRAHGPLDLVRDAEPLAQHVRANGSMRVRALARKWEEL